LPQEITEKFEDRLESIFALQKGLAAMMNLDRYPKDVEGKVAALCTAIIHEAVSYNVQQIGNGGKNRFRLIKMMQEKSLLTFGILLYRHHLSLI